MLGRTLNNRYDVQELIGEGATAAVYRAVDTRLQRTVAIKILLPYVDETTRKRFQRESLAAAQLNHPGIMAIYDVDQEGDRPYLVVEYIDGEPLFSFIPAPPETGAEYGRQICLALEYAHRQNLIHRDIKPANIHITPTGQVKIMDFGLAITGGSKRLTATGRIIGTPAYLSPEQAQGLTLTNRTDIYSTGVVLYELVTGVLPFDSDDIGVLLLQQVKKAPRPPRELVPEIPEALERVILRALEKQPEARYESAREMADALQSILTGEELPPEDDTQTTSEQGAVEQASTPKPLAAAALSGPGARVIRVALADDHRILRMSLAMYLDDNPAIRVVGQADDGPQALQMVRSEHPDVLLLDLNMPGASGLDILPEIRATWPDIKVLILTGRDEDSYIMRALSAGAHGYVLKTISEDDLVSAVKDVARGQLVLGQGVAERVIQGFVSGGERSREKRLSDLDRSILTGVAAGLTNDEVADRLKLDPQIVTQQLMTIIDQMGAKSRTEASLIALRQGLILLDDLHSF